MNKFLILSGIIFGLVLFGCGALARYRGGSLFRYADVVEGKTIERDVVAVAPLELNVEGVRVGQS